MKELVVEVVAVVEEKLSYRSKLRNKVVFVGIIRCIQILKIVIV